MAKTIGQLTDATTVGASDEIIVQQSGVTKRATVTELKAEVAALGANDITVSGANRSITNTDNYALSFGTNNTERVRIANDGKVGVGTTSPAAPLHVSGSSVFGTINVSSTSANAEASIGFYDSGDTNADKWVIGKNVGGITSDAFCFYKNANLAVIDSSGNVGIGTTSPSGARLRTVGTSAFGQALVVQSDSSASNWARMDFINQNVPSESVILAQTNTGTFFIRTEGNHDISFATNGDNTRMRITGGGNVGVGTTTPSVKLDVVGDINTSEQYLVDGTQVVSNRATGWAAPTGTATRTTFATSTATTAQLAERVKALIDDLTTHGLIGT